jgi:hypothetical protein
MATPFLIPLQPTNQTFQITLAGVVYTLTVRWNDMNGAWTLDIADQNQNPIVSGIPLVTGVDLLAPYGYLNFGGQLIAQTTNETDAVPTLANLGSSGNLYFVVLPPSSPSQSANLGRPSSQFRGIRPNPVKPVPRFGGLNL